MSAVLIDLDHVSVRLGRQQDLIIEDLSLRVSDGELIALIGPSGCGKSTVLNVLAGLVNETEGNAWVGDPGMKLAYVFQSPRLIPWWTVQKNVEFGLAQAGVSGSELASKAERAIDLVHLTGNEAKYPHQLSGGMQQRVSLARGLALEPQILLLDEPFGSLDALTRGYLQEELLNLVRSTAVTTALVTHDIDEALLLADRVVVLSSKPAKIREVLPVPFAAPRRLDELMSDPRYPKMRAHLRGLLRQELSEIIAAEPTEVVPETEPRRELFR